MDETWIDDLLREIEVEYWSKQLVQYQRYVKFWKELCEEVDDDE